MNIISNRKASRNLVPQDVFVMNGERATFLNWHGYARNTRTGLYREAYVKTPDNEIVKWSINQAGSVKVL